MAARVGPWSPQTRSLVALLARSLTLLFALLVTRYARRRKMNRATGWPRHLSDDRQSGQGICRADQPHGFDQASTDNEFSRLCDMLRPP
jgi:hypothetical protein